MSDEINQDPKKLSQVEDMKKSSRGLRADLAEQMDDSLTGNVTETGKQLIKFHGSYVQDDRDRRAEREEKKLEWAYSYMIRLRIPAGDITAAQWVGLQTSCDLNANGTMKITTRQTIQYHGVVKARMKPTMQDFDVLGLDAIAACGDVNRNVISGSNPAIAPFHAEVHEYAAAISEHLLPKTGAFKEIWLDGEKLAPDQPGEPDPLYQDRYLPRKFKIAVTIPPHNDVDVFVHDIGLIAIGKGETFEGFNVSIGGGLGATHGNAKTYPRLGDVIGFVPKDKAVETCWQIAAVQRDYGNREDRSLARLKYTLDRLGVDFFKSELEKRLGFSFAPARPYTFTHRGDPYGWFSDHHGKWYNTVFVDCGGVKDKDGYNIKSALMEIARNNLCSFRCTANQNVMLTYVEEQNKAAIDAILKKCGITQGHHTKTKEEAIACVALPTCPLALAEAQRYLPAFVEKVETLQRKHGLIEEAITTRITGCPNGCGRPYVAEIGLVGKGPGKYVLRLGGDYQGERLNRVYKEEADEAEILSDLDMLFGSFVKGRKSGETFGDYANRTLFAQAS